MKHHPNRVQRLVAVIALMILASLVRAHAADWSKCAKRYPRAALGSFATFPSPKGVYTVRVNKMGNVEVLHGAKRMVIANAVPVDLPLAEIGWAVDARGFWITASDGGLIGTWHTNLYFIQGDRVVRHDQVFASIESDMQKRFGCISAANPANIGVVEWADGGQQIHVLAEVPPSSLCRQMGMRVGYVLSVPSFQILRVLDESELMRHWKNDLGSRFRDKTE